jgi:Ca-activated chloride channel family protein
MSPPAALAALLPGLDPASHRLDQPLWLFALLLLPLVALLRRRRPVAVLVIPSAAAWAAPRPPAVRRWPVWLAHLASALLILALARPQRIDDRVIVRGEGYDLVLALDLSTSMYSEDAELDGRQVNRLEALKPVLSAFIERRPADRIGFVAFSGRAYTLAPLTHDHTWLGRQISRLRIGLIEDGTAIGDAIGLSVDRLQRARKDPDAPRAGAFVILLTDGANNNGQISPEQSMAVAKAAGIPVYTVSVGTGQPAPYPRFDESGRRVGTKMAAFATDEPLLRAIARETGGSFHRADDPSATREAFAAIDRAQKTTFDQTNHIIATELYAWPASFAAALLLLAALPLLRRR